MSDAPETNPREPRTYDKIYFWLGLGRLPSAFNVWVQEQIRSPWFPFRRMVPIVSILAMFLLLRLGRGSALLDALPVATLVIAIHLVWAFVFRDRIRSKELSRYQTHTRETPI